MKTKSFFQKFSPIFLFILLILADIITKRLAVNSGDITFNYGIIFGLFSQTNAFLRVLLLSSFGIFIFSIYLLVIFFLDSKTIFFKYFLSIFFSGVCANLIERTITSKTTDFINFTIFGYPYSFNFADIFIWVGVVLSIIYILKHDSQIWFKGNKRTYFLVNPKEQISLSIKFLFINFISFLFFGSFSITYLEIILKENAIPLREKMIFDYGIIFLIIFLIFSVYVFIISLYMTKNIFGPLKAFENYLLNNDQKDFKLRKKDRLKELEVLAEKFKSKNQD